MLGLASCQTEPEGLNVNVGGEVDTTITVTIPDTETRAGLNSAEGAFANLDLEHSDLTIRYIFEVYYGDIGVQKQVYYTDEKTASFPVRLVPGRHYNFVAWADIVTMPEEVEEETALPYEYNENNTTDVHYNTLNLKEIKLNDTWVAMDETRDAYTGFYNTASEGDNKYTGTSSINIQMTRPFAKLRVITTDMEQLNDLQIEPTYATVEYSVPHYNAFNALEGKAIGDSKNRNIKHENFNLFDENDNLKYENGTLFVDYFFANNDVVKFTMAVNEANNQLIKSNDFTTDIPVQRNYLTTIQGNILTDGNNITVKVEDAFAQPDIIETVVEVNNATEFQNAIENAENGEETVIVLGQDINLNDLSAQTQAVTRAAANDPSLTIAAGKSLTFDLNGKKLSATSTQTGKNYNMFDVRGTLTVQNGTIEYEHKGENMGWNSSTNLFNVTAGGVLNLNGVTAKNLGGSDMGFVAHLNNWGEVTLNVDNCTLESNYVAVRVFNSGYDMNNVTIKNSTLKGGSNAFWVHNYTAEDFGSEAKAEAQKELLNLDIFDESNTFSPILGIRFGFTNSLRFDSYGITRSEKDGVVTLGMLFGNGVVRRGVAGTENNEIITKVVVEEGITELPNRTFYRYKALETVELPSTLTVLGANGDDYYSNGNVFQGCAALKNIVIPESVTTMGPGVFYGCSSLESINIPAGVTRIEKDALRETGLKKVEFHENVTYFGAYAFRDSENLEEIVIKAPNFTVENNTFENAAAPYPVYTIHVANAEMKAYIESKLTANNMKHITVKAPVAVTDKASLQAALETAVKNGEKNIFIDASNFSGDMQYCFTRSNVPAGVTVTIRNAKVTGSGRWNYANGTLIFENCAFKAGVYSIHFDAGDAIVKFKNCNLVGWNSFGALTSVSFENCSLTGNGSYALIRSYADLTLKNCVIDTSLANHTDEYPEGVEAIGKTLTEENVTYIDNHTAYLQNVLKAGKHVVLSSNMNDVAVNTTAPYGNYYGFAQNGGIFDGKNHLLDFERGTQNSDGKYDNYGIMTSGGTIKNMSITGVFRGIVIMSPTEDIIVDNVIMNDPDDYGICYAINTGEGNGTKSLYVSNSTLCGWTSIGTAVKYVSFTNCTFGQGKYYTDVYGRLVKPYVDALFENCDFCDKCYIDLSAFVGTKVIVKNCTVNGVKITAENWTSLVAPENTCGDGQISVELKDGSYLTAENVADYIVFE